MALAWCVDCGREFHRNEDEKWKTRCLCCFKKMKRAEESQPYTTWRAPDEGLIWRDRFYVADAQVQMLSQEVDALRAQLAARPAFDSALADELREMLPRLRQLCHPDRHDGSVAANRASQWLNGLRSRLH